MHDVKSKTVNDAESRSFLMMPAVESSFEIPEEQDWHSRPSSRCVSVNRKRIRQSQNLLKARIYLLAAFPQGDQTDRANSVTSHSEASVFRTLANGISRASVAETNARPRPAIP